MAELNERPGHCFLRKSPRLLYPTPSSPQPLQAASSTCPAHISPLLPLPAHPGLWGPGSPTSPVSVLPWVPLVGSYTFPRAVVEGQGHLGALPELIFRFVWPALHWQLRCHLRALQLLLVTSSWLASPTQHTRVEKGTTCSNSQKSPKGSLPTIACPTTGLTLWQLTVSSAEPALGSQDSPRGRCHTGIWPCCPLCHSLSKDAKPCLQHIKTTPSMQRWILKATELYFHPNLSFQQDWWASCCSAEVTLTWSRWGWFRGYWTSRVWQRSSTPLLIVVLWFAYVAISLNLRFSLTSSRVSEMQACCTKAQKMQTEVKQFSVV